MGKKFIAVAGNIAVGKSTLTAMLSEVQDWKPFYEAVDENPYLADFYADMARWSFHSQVFFLSRKVQLHQEILNYPGTVVHDRSIYEDAEIFARNLFLRGYMAERDYWTYRELYESLTSFLAPPDLVVYLRASVPTLLHRIALRGREFERDISPEYLGQLNTLYEEWIAGFTLCPVLTVPADKLDFVKYNSHMEIIAARIWDKLQGKEEVVFT